MKKELFIPYKEMIVRCIDSCVNPDQLAICQDMMSRLHEQFMHCIGHKERNEVTDELCSRWLQKQAELSV